LFVLLVVGAGTAWAQLDPCGLALAELNAAVTPCPLFVCPHGDTPSFIDQGWSISIWVYGISGNPIPNVPASDFWLVDCDPGNDASLCGGSASSNADSNTGTNGKTTMSLGTLVGGGCADGIAVVAQGLVILDTTLCVTEFCFPIWLRSPDIDGSLEVDLVDLSIFAASFPPRPFDPCCDMNVDGRIGLQDLSLFAFHFGPPGHICL
jgi:hypothetical protein